MATSSKILKTQIDCRLSAGGLSALACCQLQGAQNILSTQVVVSVANCAALPSASLNQGRMVYLNDICQYRVSDGTTWGSDFSSSVKIQWRQLFGWGATDNRVTAVSSPVQENSSSLTWCQVSAGGISAGIKTDGSLWSWGSGYGGGLGNNSVTSTSSPVREITSSSTWRQVSTGGNTSALKTDGTLWTWGSAFCGLLGDNTLINKSSPVREITSSSNWCQTSNGACHMAAVKTDGTLWAWGAGVCCRLGNNSYVSRSSPVRESLSSTTWCQVSAGGCHTAAIKTDGTLWAWGNNVVGQLGNAAYATPSQFTPVREVTSSTTWCQVAAGRYSTSAIKTDGALWTWGDNRCGQLGSNVCGGYIRTPVREITSSTTWCQVALPNFGTHVAAIKTDGTLWTWGNNVSGQLGNNTAGIGVVRSSPVREITSSTTWCQASAGTAQTAAIKTNSKGFS
jgi:alpha-tubulin suppressor-like RCC1 family protein